MEIVFIVGSVSDSHIIKRINSFIDKGYSVQVYGFSRNVNSVNKLSNINVNIIGYIENGKYQNRILNVFESVRRIVKSHLKSTIYYVWGFDIASVCSFLNCKYIYEISDIVYSDFCSPIRQIFKYIDRNIISKSLFSVLTSEGFINYLSIHDDRNIRNIVLMPNKLDKSFSALHRKSFEIINHKLRIGFIGYYRYPDTILRLARIIGENYEKDYEFHFFGTGTSLILDKISKICKYNNVFEHGPFRNPEDLIDIYDSIDIVACNYDSRGANEKIAEPNKLYESLYFNKPIIVSKGTFLSKRVESLNCGFSIDSLSDANIVDFLDNLSMHTVNKIGERISSINKEYLIENYDVIWDEIDRRKIFDL